MSAKKSDRRQFLKGGVALAGLAAGAAAARSAGAQAAPPPASGHSLQDALAQEAAVECGRVAKALSVPGTWTEDAARDRWESVARATSANLCSTVQDLRRRRKSEIHAINGAVARAARQASLTTTHVALAAPVNELLAALISAREELLRIPNQR